MKILLCQPNLIGFLSAVYAAYYTEKDADDIRSDADSPSLLDTTVTIAENYELARKVKDGILKKGGRVLYDEILDAYRNSAPQKEGVLFQFLRLLFRHGRSVQEMLDNAAVIAFNDLAAKVRGEIHRMRGFIRFHEMENGVYYGYYTTDHDVIERLMPHFVQTYSVQCFVLHDYARKKLGIYDGKNIHYMYAPDTMSVVLSERELMFQTLWKNYHKDIAVEGRENPKLQRHFLPKKYRHFLDEFLD